MAKNQVSQIEILAKINLGLSDAEIAKLLDAKIEEVAKVRAESMQSGLVRRPKHQIAMTHEEREQRRQEIAEYVKDGHTYQEASEKFSVSVSSVGAACREFGTTRQVTPELRIAEIFKVASRFITGIKDSEIAAELKTSRERVRQMRELAEEAGLFDSLRTIVQHAMEQGRRQAS